MHKAWSSIEEVSYCFSRTHPSNFKVTGDKKIIDFDPNWAFPDCIAPVWIHRWLWNDAHNTLCIIWRAILHRLSKCYSIHNKGQSWHLMHDPSCMSEIIGIRNDTIHETILDPQLNILWQNAFSDLYIFDHQWVNISLGSMLECFTWQLKLDLCVKFHCSVCMRMEDFFHSLGQNFRLEHV